MFQTIELTTQICWNTTFFGSNILFWPTFFRTQNCFGPQFFFSYQNLFRMLYLIRQKIYLTKKFWPKKISGLKLVKAQNFKWTKDLLQTLQIFTSKISFEVKKKFIAKVQIFFRHTFFSELKVSKFCLGIVKIRYNWIHNLL